MRNRLITAALITCSLLMLAWIKHPFAAEPFTATYVLGFVLSIGILISGGAWAITGFGGIKNIANAAFERGWFAVLFTLAGWASLSQSWAMVRDYYPGVAQNAALQLWLVALFVLMVLSSHLSRRIMTTWFIGAVMIAAVGMVQVILQRDLGLPGEFSLDPARSGVSVIQSGDIRQLRPYGLLPHPNIFAGILIAGLFSAAGLLNHKHPRWRLIAHSGAMFLLWALLLSFSRGAWLAFLISGILCGGLAIWQRALPRSFKYLVAGGIVIGLLFTATHRHFIAARTAISGESIELRSISDRIVYTEIALQAIAERPLTGHGGGNFAWYASDYLATQTDFELRGDNVHNVYLLVLAEYGAVGLTLFLVLFGSTLIRALLLLRQDPAPLWRIGVLGIVIAFALVGIVDHYPWTTIHTQTIWLTAAALAIRPSPAVEPEPA